MDYTYSRQKNPEHKFFDGITYIYFSQNVYQGFPDFWKKRLINFIANSLPRQKLGAAKLGHYQSLTILDNPFILNAP
jgi:hypothetical protein